MTPPLDEQRFSQALMEMVENKVDEMSMLRTWPNVNKPRGWQRHGTTARRLLIKRWAKVANVPEFMVVHSWTLLFRNGFISLQTGEVHPFVKGWLATRAVESMPRAMRVEWERQAEVRRKEEDARRPKPRF